MKTHQFNQYTLSEPIVKALSLMGYTSPTEVQHEAIPVLKLKKDLIIKSETGSGKTAAFAIPIIDDLIWEDNAPQVLVLTPTRELAQQVRDEMFNIGRFKRMKAVAVYGKSPIDTQIRLLKQKTHIVAGTPGRIFDHIERETIDLSNIKYLILDEADEMLNMGFLEQIEAILAYVHTSYNMVLLSATLPKDVTEISQKYMNDPVHIEIEKQTTHSRIEQRGIKVAESKKLDCLIAITTIENPDSCIIFCNTRAEVDTVHDALEDRGYPCRKLHGGMEQDTRTKVIQNFRKNYFRYLVATDVAARGIDIEDISLVVNYDLPEEAEVYIHRIGRTGRNDKTGLAISLIGKDAYFLKAIHAINQGELIMHESPTEEEIEQAQDAFDEKIQRRPKVKADKHEDLHEEILKIHINAGKKTKMRASDIVGTLCSIESITKEDIGNIDILDISTYVEILNDKGEHVLKVLQTKPIKGRVRNVSKVDDTKARGRKNFNKSNR